MRRILLMPLMWLINARPYNLRGVHPGDYILWKNELWQFQRWICDGPMDLEQAKLYRNKDYASYPKRHLHDARTLSAWELKARQDADKAMKEATV